MAWRTWLNIRVTADKYLEPKLSEVADRKYREAALTRINADDIFDVLETIWVEMSHDESLVAFGEQIRKNNLGKLLKNARFREHLDSGGKDALWQQLDELAFSANLQERMYVLCGHHKQVVFKAPFTRPMGNNYYCSLCVNEYYSPAVDVETAWISK